ncbi:MAG TPA: hypothetical protein VFL49_08520 [Pseudolabrys sp.]|nr:hypothetical protein [Pseudolabrys sp.]
MSGQAASRRWECAYSIDQTRAQRPYANADTQAIVSASPTTILADDNGRARNEKRLRTAGKLFTDFIL